MQRQRVKPQGQDNQSISQWYSQKELSFVTHNQTRRTTKRKWEGHKHKQTDRAAKSQEKSTCHEERKVHSNQYIHTMVLDKGEYQKASHDTGTDCSIKGRKSIGMLIYMTLLQQHR